MGLKAPATTFYKRVLLLDSANSEAAGKLRELESKKNVDGG